MHPLPPDWRAQGDARTPDVVDAEWWLSLPKDEAMRELLIPDEFTYLRVYREIEAAVSRRNDRASQTGIRASVVIKRPGAPLVDT